MDPAPLRRRLGRAAVLLGASLVVLVGTGRPVGADPARPTNFESRVLSVDPPLRGATVEIQGGDAFVVLSVDRGHEAVVPDYGDDGTTRPYLRFLDDGTVQVNERSAAASANERRFGSAGPGFDAGSEPVWRTVDDDGSYAWHDHRVHLMVPDDVAVIDDRGRVDLGGDDGTWSVPFVVDGVDTVVRGELVRLGAPTAWPWYVGVAVVGGAALALLARAVPLTRRVAPVALLVVGAACTYVAVAELARAPEGSGAPVAPVAVAGAALVGAVAVLVARALGRRGGALARGGAALAATTLSWWGATRTGVFAHAILPSGLDGLDRSVTAAAIGLGVATAVTLVWRPDAWATAPTPRPPEGS